MSGQQPDYQQSDPYYGQQRARFGMMQQRAGANSANNGSKGGGATAGQSYYGQPMLDNQLTQLGMMQRRAGANAAYGGPTGYLQQTRDQFGNLLGGGLGEGAPQQRIDQFRGISGR